MSNADKLLKNKKEKAPRQRVKKVKVDLSNLPDALVDGKLRVKEKGRVVFERTRSKRTALHEGFVMGVNTDGTINLYDETAAQIYVIDPKQPPPSFKAKSASELA